METSELNQKIPQQTLGAIVKEARLKSKISINEVSRHTKIHKTLLLHLENDRYERLPDKVYISGFLKSLSTILDFDLDEAQKLIGQKNKKLHKLESKWGDIKKISLNIPLFYKRPLGTSRKVFLTIVSSLTIAVLFISIMLNYKFSKKILVTDTLADTKITEKIIITQDPSPASAKVLVTQKNPVSLMIKALHGNSWIAYKTNNNKTVTLTLKKGNHLKLKADTIRLILGNYHALNIIKNGNEYSYEGKLTKNVAYLIFPEKLKNEYEMPYINFNKQGSTAINESVKKNVEI